MKVLLLGGTQQAMSIAQTLLAHNSASSDANGQPVKLIYSIAGIVRQPALNCSIHSGGFSQFAPDSTSLKNSSKRASQQGLEHFIKRQKIEKVIDATHPYAVTMSTTASIVCESLNIPLLRYHRPPWQATEQDRWINVTNWAEAQKAMHPFKRPFVTIGRIANSDLDSIPKHQFWLIRSAIGECLVKDQYRLIKAIGPFSDTQEMELIKTHRIDVVVCKNSGGNAVDGKLNAARKLNIPVIMLDRPEMGSSQSNGYSNEHNLISALFL